MRITVTIQKAIVAELERLRESGKINSSDNAKFVYNAMVTYKYLIDEVIKGNEIIIYKGIDNKPGNFIPADLMELKW